VIAAAEIVEPAKGPEVDAEKIESSAGNPAGVVHFQGIRAYSRAMRKRLYSLDELDDIPGTKIFNAMRSRQAYHLHKFCMSLMNAANREAFRADEGAYLDRFRMSPEQKKAVRDRDFNQLIELGGNIYFLEPYDPAKTPILFVHGAAGSPQNWTYFFQHIDRTRYQPWIFYYPSGSSVDSMSYLLFWKLSNLQRRYHFNKIYFTAHSMGGLVVRNFLANMGGYLPVSKAFISLSTLSCAIPGIPLYCGICHKADL